MLFFIISGNKLYINIAIKMFSRTSNKTYVYKSIWYDLIVTLELLQDTEFSQLSVSKYVDEHVAHLINKAKIVKIEHKITKTQYTICENFYLNSRNYIYGSTHINQIIMDTSYDCSTLFDGTNITNRGICVFKSYNAAFYSELPSNYTGKWNVYKRRTGTLQSTYNIVNGKRHGEYINFQLDGKSIEYQTNYINNIENGERLTYFSDTLIKYETILNNKKNGLVIYFEYPTKYIISKCIYENDSIIQTIEDNSNKKYELTEKDLLFIKNTEKKYRNNCAKKWLEESLINYTCLSREFRELEFLLNQYKEK